MWKSLYEAIKSIFIISERVDRHDKDIESLKRDVQKLTLAIQALSHEINDISNREKSEREKLALQLENNLLKFEKRLPSGKE
jgi:chromosome segregation ATPase